MKRLMPPWKAKRKPKESRDAERRFAMKHYRLSTKLMRVAKTHETAGEKRK
jgi:hypothetical protein